VESVEFTEIWGPPTSTIGRLVQFGFLATLLGTVPLAIVGCLLLRIRRGQRSSRWVGIARIATLLQAGGVLSSLMVGGLFLSETHTNETLGEIVGPLGVVLGFVCVNLTAAALGLRSWLALGRTKTRAG
jgi:hypothetical protein